MAEGGAVNLCAALLAVLMGVLPTPGGTVSVLYAGSLVRTMEGPLASSLRERTGLVFSGEGKGSRALAHLISAGLRTPDVFISAEPSLLKGIARKYVVFGSARMLVAYSPNSPHRALFEDAAAGRRSILAVLDNPSVRVGRTDPQLDPKGSRTVRVLSLLGTHYHAAGQANAVLAKAGVFPEEDLAVRVESGDLDAGFFYSTEMTGRGFQAVELPDDSNLSNEIAYAIGVVNGAPNPAAAQTFIGFVLRGDGRRILESAGLRYFAHPQIISTK
jgi:molybdate/tungstate transport system substrate-binding protein